MFGIGITEIKDKYNPSKTWVVKKSKNRHYYINQKIGDRFVNNSFTHCSLSYILDILN